MRPNKPTDLLLVATPVLLWCLHLCCIVPLLDTMSGEAQFITAMQFFFASTVVMIVCELIALWRLATKPCWACVIAAALNLSWIYYIKVVLFGPTIGNL